VSGRIRFGHEIAPGKRVGVLQRDGAERFVVAARPSDGVPLVEGSEVISAGTLDADGWQPVTVLYRQGPSQVATPAYRDGYERIFGRGKVGVA
jgi:hypothetical protein